MPTLSQTQLDALEMLKNTADRTENKQDRYAYYEQLFEDGFNYGTLAAGVVRDNTLSGVIANGFLALRSSGHKTVILNADLSVAVQTELVNADFSARKARMLQI